MKEQGRMNPLGQEKISKLLRQFAVPSIIAMLVSSLYNIVDQFFIGQRVGELGNAATNISFPLSISCVAIALLFGIGGASAFNISMGKGEFDPEEKEKAVFYMGNAAVSMFGCGVILLLITQLFLTPMLRFFGSPTNVMEYAKVYTRIVSFGFPFVIFATGGGHLVRADGRPKYTMISNLTGAVINTILDAVFVFGFNWGMAGAAYATIIGQFVSAVMVFYFLRHCKTVKIERKHLKVRAAYVQRISSLGAAPCSNQLAMMVVQIVMNQSLKYYGSLSVYGEAIPIACAGIISKVNMVFMSFIIGISQGLQPIVSYNYGAGHYKRVKKAYIMSIGCGFVLAVIAFLLFHFAPRQIISIFGNGSEEYFQFAIQYFKVFLFFTFINFMQPITSNFYTAIGKPGIGMFLSLTRQIIFLLPLLLLLPRFVGIDGIMYSGPIADLLAGIVCISMIVFELKRKEYQAK
ncbi:multi antimicrobial extrusion protein (Na(+)/drug antiporter), MATE family of MDR efflux pumps [Lachnospiraceae bacterium KM106-2]|nr:multi antimicrobial extrusion protein (Na(+)/drug antiporter), MATE family of MDR efflux pumps [Lachnospiraceae bacterium KM106-2]